VEKGALVWTWNQFHTPLVHYESDEFTAPLEIIDSPHITFTLNAAGAVSAMKVAEPMNAEFRRK
jgi:hypothetical protein